MQGLCNDDLDNYHNRLITTDFGSDLYPKDFYKTSNSSNFMDDFMDITDLPNSTLFPNDTNESLDSILFNANHHQSHHMEDILSNNASPIDLLDDIQVLQWNLEDTFIETKLFHDQSDESSTSSSSIGSTSPIRNDFICNSTVSTSIEEIVKKSIENDRKQKIQLPKLEKQIKPNKVPIKRIPIKPKTLLPSVQPQPPTPPPPPPSSVQPLTTPTTTSTSSITTNSNILMINNELVNASNVVTTQPPKMVVYNPMLLNTTSIIKPVQSNPIAVTSTAAAVINSKQIDPKMFKRQQRKIKNRESACLSRKKKKDYLNSLEDQVKELSDENKKLKEENLQLKQRLSLYEDDKTLSGSKLNYKKPTILTLCAFLCVLTFNFDILSSFSRQSTISSSDYSTYDKHQSRRSLLWDVSDDTDKTMNNYNYSAICPAAINQSESARLLLDLKRWIDQPNKSSKPINYPIKEKLQHRRKIFATTSIHNIPKQIPLPENRKPNEIDVFHPKQQQSYPDFFEAINRRDDTFYVVSFSEQHLLIPALYHNKTRRPKMSLLMASILPANGTSNYTDIPLMQIDCEVLDTKSVSIKYGTIPREYRQYSNMSNTPPPSTKPSSPSSQKLKKKSNSYKPYFLSKNNLNGDIN